MGPMILTTISEEELIERFAARSVEEIAELFQAHPPLKEWFIANYNDTDKVPITV
jgi:hypothetical protein